MTANSPVQHHDDVGQTSSETHVEKLEVVAVTHTTVHPRAGDERGNRDIRKEARKKRARDKPSERRDTCARKKQEPYQW